MTESGANPAGLLRRFMLQALIAATRDKMPLHLLYHVQRLGVLQAATKPAQGR